ncbi:MAG: transcriptional regulator [Flaviaesturariibacter sp.]|nr:transcriptional regulator [Flaviaesturariibacter sp.]
MSDFRLSVFYAVAKRLSFTRAAAELFISQPAVTRHVHELEAQYGTKLFEREGSSVRLTPAGDRLLRHAEDVFALQRALQADLDALLDRHGGMLRLGASTTIAQYVIPPLLAGFRQQFPGVSVTLLNGNTEQVEGALLHREIELGIIEGRSKKAGIRYSPFLEDRLVLVTAAGHPLTKRKAIAPADLTQVPLLLREPGSGTLEVIEHALKPWKIGLSHLQVEMQLGSTESIKSYLVHSGCAAFLSIHSIAKELDNGSLAVVPVTGLPIERSFYFIQLQGKAEPLAEIFLKFARGRHNPK